MSWKTLLGTMLLVFAWVDLVHSMELKVLEATGTQPVVISPNHVLTQLYDNSYALIISEAAYASSDGKAQWPQLDTVNDEQDRVATALRAQGFIVWRVKDAKSDELRSVIRNFVAQNGHSVNSRIVFFFSGHGYTNPNNHFSYIVPVDAPRPDVDKQGMLKLAIPILDLQTVAREIEARHALFLFDSCFSGGIFLERGLELNASSRGTTSDERWRFLRDSASKPVRQFISAGEAGETLPAVSAFTSLFLSALQGAASTANDGYVSGKEIGVYLEQRVPNYVPREHPHSGLIRDPDLSLGDIIFQTETQVGTAVEARAPSKSGTFRIARPPFLLGTKYALPFPYEQMVVAPEFDLANGNPVRYAWRWLSKEDFGANQPCFGKDSTVVWFFQNSFEVRRISFRFVPDGECPSVDSWETYLFRFFSIQPSPKSEDYVGESQGFKMLSTRGRRGELYVDIDEPNWNAISYQHWREFHNH